MNVLITGGAGFLGRAIVDNDRWPGDCGGQLGSACYTVLSRDEAKHEAMRRRFPQVRTVLGDVRDMTVLEPLMHGMDLVIHAAAVKFVDEAEHNVVETIDVNVRGTNSVLLAAARAGVKTVVFVSTDKATAPLNTYGATKQLGERLVGEYARRWPNTRFVACRYGNVVGSTGSVTWKWAQAIERDEAIAMTDARMTRFWMAPHEAVVVIERATRMPSGTVTIPMCAAMTMGDVADAMGTKKSWNMGIRPGERMDEMLLSAEEAPRAIVDGEHILLRPAYEAGRHDGVRGYTSRTPLRWLEADELRAMVEEARALW